MKRLFSMSAFDGLRSIRLHIRATGNPDVYLAVRLLRQISADSASLDYESAIDLNRLVSSNAPLDDPQAFYRSCLLDVIVAHKSGWARMITLGRNRLFSQLERDELQCFRSAGVAELFPDLAMVRWWDELAGQMRRLYDAQKMERAREAEWRTIEHETQRLAKLGIQQKPKWMAIEDNTAGYDVLSFDKGTAGPVNRLIEVKSTIASPLRFYLTRNEWEKARNAQMSYVFHVWNLSASPPRLFEISAQDISSHIPTDRGSGRWSNVEIPISC